MPVAEDTFLSDDFLRQLMSVGEVDLLVAIPTHNNAETIGKTVAAIEESFQTNFPRARAVVVNVDGGSHDGTCDAALNAGVQPRPDVNPVIFRLNTLRTEHRVATRYADTPSPGLAFRTILTAADLMRAKACAIVSPAISSVTAEWITNLLQPVYQKEFDFVAPLYSRRKSAGLLARNLLYPMSRAVFGKGIRELHSSEIGLSPRLVSQALNQDVWHEEAMQNAPELWLGVMAISSDFKCCQSFLGEKEYTSPGSQTGVVDAIRQIVGTLFWCMEQREEVWMGKTTSCPVPSFGPDHEVAAGPPSGINKKKIHELFQSGVSQLAEILTSILSTDTHAEIERLAALDAQKFRFGNELWARTLCEFAASYHHAPLNRDHLIQALVPLYRGRMYSFLVQHRDSSQEEMEADSEELCRAFEQEKSYLIERWKAKV